MSFSHIPIERKIKIIESCVLYGVRAIERCLILSERVAERLLEPGDVMSRDRGLIFFLTLFPGLHEKQERFVRLAVGLGHSLDAEFDYRIVRIHGIILPRVRRHRNEQQILIGNKYESFIMVG
jgi:hypothetical protein